MVAIEQFGDSQTRITLTPNRSASWAQTRLFLILLGIPVFAIAVGWLAAGIWMVLPFSGLEYGLVVLLAWRVSQRTYERQLLWIDRGTIRVEQGFRTLTSRGSLPRRTTCLRIMQSAQPLDLPRLSLVEQHDAISIGEFLNLEDRKQLRHALRELGVMELRNRWWESGSV